MLATLIYGCADAPGPYVVAGRLAPSAFGARPDTAPAVAILGNDVRSLAGASVAAVVDSPALVGSTPWARAVFTLTDPMAAVPPDALRPRLIEFGADVAKTMEELLAGPSPSRWAIRRHPKDPHRVKVAVAAPPGAKTAYWLIRLEGRSPFPTRLESSPFDLPRGARLGLAFGLGASPNDAPTTRATFRATLDCAWTPARVVVETTLRPGEDGPSRWHDATIDLWWWERRGCRLVLEAEASAGTSPMWATPRIDAPSGRPDPPHVILVSLDTVRADHLTTYGYLRPTSLALSELVAMQGTTFTEVSSTFPRTTPAHASIFAGLYPAALPASGNLPPEATTLTTRFRDAGYDTIGITEDGLVGYEYGFANGFDRLAEFPVVSAPEVRGHAVFDAARDVIARHHDRPLFLFLHTYKAHAPYAPSTPYRTVFQNDMTQGLWGQWEGVDRDLLEDLHDYDRSIRELDDVLRRFLEHLDTIGTADRTVLVIVSDHGEAFAEHGWAGHGLSAHQEVLRVPFLMRGPGVPVGHRVHTPVSLADVAPTILDLMGLPPIDGAQGRSMMPELRGGPAIGMPQFFAWPKEKYGVRLGMLKLLVSGSQVLLFDLFLDPHERHPLRREPSVKSLRSLLDQHLAESATRRAAWGHTVSPEEPPGRHEALKALGYVE